MECRRRINFEGVKTLYDYFSRFSSTFLMCTAVVVALALVAEDVL